MLIPRDEVVWKTVDYLELPDETFEYQLTLPEPLASWDVFGAWERARVHSMRDNLNLGDVLFDVGTEQGWLNLVYAKFVGPENMVLIEPTACFWPNIQATWDKNYPDASGEPLRMYEGLLSDKTTETKPDDPFWDALGVGWPNSASGDLVDRNKYQYIHANEDNVPEIRMDDFVSWSGVVPDALTIDVEGAELLVLKGGLETLLKHHPIVWCSIHPDLMERDYHSTPDQVHDLMKSLGYLGEHLWTDHEEHHFFRPRRGL